MRKSLICPRTSALQPQSLIPRKMHTNSFASKSDQSRSLITGPCSILIKDFFLRQSWLIPSFFRFIFNCQHSFFFLDVSFLTYTCSLHPPPPPPPNLPIFSCYSSQLPFSPWSHSQERCYMNEYIAIALHTRISLGVKRRFYIQYIIVGAGCELG